MIHTRYPLILGSKSPRRQQLLRELGFEFSIIDVDTDETVPDTIKPGEAAGYLAEKKARSCLHKINDEILLTADTVVILNGQILGKPADNTEAGVMLKKLSGRKHEVITGICILFRGRIHSASEITRVSFQELSEKEIDYYLTHFNPLDKAGAYGIQEWIGMIGIRDIDGSYFNVVGLPLARVYAMLKKLDLLEL